jgi:hypothetical protein
VQVYPDLCWVVRRLIFKENTTGGRAVSGSNRNFMEIQVVGVDLARPYSIWQGGWTKIVARDRLSRSQICGLRGEDSALSRSWLAFPLGQKSRG